MKILLDRSRSGLRAVVLAFAALTAAGCSDQPLDSRAPDTPPSHNYTLPAVEGIACKHGGEYPFCRPPSTPDGMEPGTEPPPPDGGGDGGSDEVPPLCDSRESTACLKPLTTSDSAVVQAARGTLKTASEFRDSRVAEICAAFGAQLNSLFDQSRVFRGADGIPDNVDNEDASHKAQAWRTPDGSWVIHIDGDELDKAAAAGLDSGWEKVIADWLLHEVAHTLNYTHPGETVAPYVTEPFNHASGGPAEQCVR